MPYRKLPKHPLYPLYPRILVLLPFVEKGLYFYFEASYNRVQGHTQHAEGMVVRKQRGRPAWEPNLDRIEELASFGLTQEQIAAACHITPKTFSEHKYSDDNLRAAISRGQAKGITAVANKLFEAAMRGNVVAAIFYLKARAGWREADGVPVQQGQIAALVVPGITSAEEWAKIYEQHKKQQAVTTTVQ